MLLCWVIILQRNFCLDFTENNWLSHHFVKSPWSIVKGFTFFTHVCDCSVKTELICRNNYVKNSLNCFLVGSKVNRQTVFRVLCFLELTPGQWSRCTEKIGHPLSANSTSILSAIWSQIPCGLFSSIEYHFFSEPGPNHCPMPNFFAYIETTLAFAKHSSSLSFHRKCRWTST